MINKAMKFAQKAHSGQVRKFTGEPYYNHVKRVHDIVATVTDNVDILCAALLHDTIEDCNVQAEQLEYEFNMVVAAIVDELTNVYTKDNYPKLNRSERKKQEAIRIGKISYSGKIVKISDRIDNLSTGHYGAEHYYLKESAELLSVLRGVNPILEERLEKLVYPNTGLN